MPLTISEIKQHLPGFPAELLEEIAEHGMMKEVPELYRYKTSFFQTIL
jgi:hypothetical protein